MREEVFRLTGSAWRHTWLLRHQVVMDVFRQDATSLKEDSEDQDLIWLQTNISLILLISHTIKPPEFCLEIIRLSENHHVF